MSDASPTDWVISFAIEFFIILVFMIFLSGAELKSLPVSVFSGEEEPLECAICLSDFEENEAGRTLPKCNHTFHVDCIDTWLVSHHTCPLCRSGVRSTAGQFSISVAAEPSI